MELAYLRASQLLAWLNKIHVDRNREQFNDLYSKISDYLRDIFQSWVNYNSPDLLVKVIELLSSRSQNNLFSAIIRPESGSFHHQFPISSLPMYVQNILKNRRLSELPKFYTGFQIIVEKGVIILPTIHFYLFTFMAESCKNRHAEWFEEYSFLEFIYNNPFLIIFSHYLQDLDDEILKFIAELAQEYIIKDPAYRESPAPSRHSCEMLLLLIYTLQRPSHLLLPSFRLININPDSTLFPISQEFYLLFRNQSLCWQQGTNTYCSHLLEIWLQLLAPWHKNEILSKFMQSDYLLTPSKSSEKDYNGEEPYWEDYINQNILLYTECFGLSLKLMSNELVFRPGDITILYRICELFSTDSEGNLIEGKLNFFKIKQWSRGGSLPPVVELALKTFNLKNFVLNPFFDQQLKGLAEILVYKAESLGYPEVNEIKNKWNSLLGIRNKGPVKEIGKKHARVNVIHNKSMLNVWDKPIRSDELFVLYLGVKYLAWVVDRVRKRERKWPPETDLRFFASYTNLLFLVVAYFVIRFVFFR